MGVLGGKAWADEDDDDDDEDEEAAETNFSELALCKLIGFHPVPLGI